MKKLLIFILLSFSVAQAQNKGLTQSVSNMQSETSEKVKQLLMQKDSERNSGTKTVSKNYASFKPSPSENLKNIANELGKTADEKATFLQVFAEVKKNFESQAANKKNNIAAAMTFLMATSVMVYQQSPEPSDAATEKLFNSLNSMFDEMPTMASIPSKDKQFLYDLYISYGGLILASYQEAVGTKNKETIDAIRIIAGSTLLDLFKINPNEIYFEGESLRMKSESSESANTNQTSQPTSRSHNFAKQTTKFDDGWVATALNDYVQLQRNGAEIRLFYVNKQWDDSRLNTVEPNDYFWNKTVAPYFNVSNVQKWSGVEYPVIYFQQADVVDKQTGTRYFLAMKIVFQGGANVITAIYPNRGAYERDFKHPNNLDPMLNANRFAVTAQDLVGTWASGANGGGFDFYGVAGTYIGSSSLSQDNEFVFNSNGSYQHTYKSANLNTGSSQFARIDYKGRFSASDWEVVATNHYNGTTAKFAAQIVAVRNGYLLVMTDKRNNLNYTLFKKR
jgi:hypothetical protein